MCFFFPDTTHFMSHKQQMVNSNQRKRIPNSPYMTIPQLDPIYKSIKNKPRFMPGFVQRWMKTRHLKKYMPGSNLSKLRRHIKRNMNSGKNAPHNNTQRYYANHQTLKHGLQKKALDFLIAHHSKKTNA